MRGLMLCGNSSVILIEFFKIDNFHPLLESQKDAPSVARDIGINFR